MTAPADRIVLDGYDEAVTVFRDARMAAGMTQACLGRKVGVGGNTIAHRENGRRIAGAPALFATAHALGYTVVLIPVVGAA